MCDCLENVQSKLGERGVMLPTNLPLLGGTEIPFFPLYRTDTGKLETRSGRPKYVMPTYCPFCGTEYARDGGEHGE